MMNIRWVGYKFTPKLSDVVKGDDVMAILTKHDEYFGLDARVLKGLMEQGRPVIADGFIGARFVYMGIGRGDKNGHAIR